MRNTFLITAFFICSLLSAQVLGPKISAQSPTYDFGEIKEGEVVSHEFTIMNVGDAVLEIQKVRASCGCTAAKPGKDKLEPGESTTIKAEFNSSKRRGHQKKYVYVFTNDPETPQFRLSFTANILTEENSLKAEVKGARLVLSEKYHNFGTVEEGSVLDLEIGVKNAGKELLKIDKVKTSCGCTAAMLSSNRIDPNESGTLKIEFDTSNRVGRYTRTVTLHTNDPIEPQQTITLMVKIEAKGG